MKTVIILSGIVALGILLVAGYCQTARAEEILAIELPFTRLTVQHAGPVDLETPQGNRQAYLEVWVDEYGLVQVDADFTYRSVESGRDQGGMIRKTGTFAYTADYIRRYSYPQGDFIAYTISSYGAEGGGTVVGVHRIEEGSTRVMTHRSRGAIDGTTETWGRIEVQFFISTGALKRVCMDVKYRERDGRIRISADLFYADNDTLVEIVK